MLYSRAVRCKLSFHIVAFCLFFMQLFSDSRFYGNQLHYQIITSKYLIIIVLIQLNQFQLNKVFQKARCISRITLKRDFLSPL